MAWTIEIDERARKQLKKLGFAEAGRIISFLEERLAKLDNPRQLGDAMQGQKFKHLWRYRVGNYRIICDIEDSRLVVLVVDVGHRGGVYR